MTSTAQNGWPVVDQSACDNGTYAGVRIPNGVLAGDVAIIARWHMAEYDRRVEPLVAGSCWGYDKKQIGTSGTWSNHAAGCAWDLNADQHNDGDPPENTFTQEQIDECHALERESDGVLRWGGDWSDPDGMHWEIVGSKQQAAALAAKINGDDLPMEQADFDRLMDGYLKKVTKDSNGWERTVIGPAILDHHWMPNPLNNDGGKAPVYDVLRDTAQAAADNRAAVDGLETKLDQVLAILNPPV